MWKVTSKKKYWEALEVLPPAYQDGRGFLVGESVDHRQCSVTHNVLPTYEAFIQSGTRYYVSVRAVTIPEYKAAKKPGGSRA